MSIFNPTQLLHLIAKTSARTRDGWNALLISLFGMALFSALLPFFYPIPFRAEWNLFLLAAANLMRFFWDRSIFLHLGREIVTSLTAAGVLIAISGIYLWIAVRNVRINRE